MQQTIERASGRSRPGFLRRFLVRTDGPRKGLERSPAEPAAPPPTIIDLRGDLPAAQWRAAVSERLERLETGISLVAGTMKRAFAQVFRSIEELGDAHADPDGEIARIVDDSFTSLKSAVDELSESIRQVPHVLAAAADDISAQLQAAPSNPGGDDRPFQAIPGPPDPSATPELLPAMPFELEPVEEQFATMDESPGGVDAGRIWGSEATKR
ncbi:MAG: hypothetical protein ACRDHO_13675 [Actinomycetota bacterium]